MPGEFESFGPKILVVGRHDRARTLILRTLLEDAQDRFGVLSAGIDPAEEVDPAARAALREAGYEPAGAEPQSIGASLNDHLQLVAFVTESVRTEGPIVATPGEKLTLDVPSPEPGRDDDYQTLVERVEARELPRILEALPGDLSP